VAVGRWFARGTDGGRRWPHRAWNAQLEVEDYSLLQNALTTKKLPDGGVRVAELFDTMPLAIIEALYQPQDSRAENYASPGS
jgi:hypothetical protein